MKKQYQYLIAIQYLGFRFHGWAKQPNQKTIQGEIEKNIKYVIGHTNFMTLGASRTDSMVSAHQNAFSLFTDDFLDVSFIEKLAIALPNDISVVSIQRTPSDFNIISHSKSKEYRYNFTTSSKFHPFDAHLSTHIKDPLDIELMKQGALLFEGNHSFHNFCYKPKENTTFKRTITTCIIEEKGIEQYSLKVIGTGFLRHQIRIIMGCLFNLGQHKINLEDIQKATNPLSEKTEIGFIAPASGLTLVKINFKDLII